MISLESDVTAKRLPLLEASWEEPSFLADALILSQFSDATIGQVCFGILLCLSVSVASATLFWAL